MSSLAPLPNGVPMQGTTFHTTKWSVVLAARQPEQETAAREALASLCATYWYPLYAFIRHQGIAPEEAEDLTQEFFYRFLERNSLLHVAPAAGKFRSFLLTCLKNFIANERERARAQRRGGGEVLIALDACAAETRYMLEPADEVTPEVLFERHWASAVLERALSRLKQEYARRGQHKIFDALEAFLPGSGAGASRADTAASLGMSTGAVDMAICRLRQRYGAMLREEVAQTVASADEIEDEIRHLMSVFEA